MIIPKILILTPFLLIIPFAAAFNSIIEFYGRHIFGFFDIFFNIHTRWNN